MRQQGAENIKQFSAVPQKFGTKGDPKYKLNSANPGSSGTGLPPTRFSSHKSISGSGRLLNVGSKHRFSNVPSGSAFESKTTLYLPPRHHKGLRLQSAK